MSCGRRQRGNKLSCYSQLIKENPEKGFSKIKYSEICLFDFKIKTVEVLQKMTNEAKELEIVEIARTTGKIRKGANEATKALEKGQAKLVVYALDVTPKEIIMHLPLLAKEKNIPCFGVSKKDDLGAAAGLAVSTAAVAVVKEGDAKSAIESLPKSQE